MFTFTVGIKEPINLNIYNSNGQLVRRIMNQNILEPGNFTIVWDGNDQYGNSLPNGSYNYCLQGQQHGEKCGIIILNRTH
jgi:flagellar hook assembly protein FlgD